MLYTPYLRPELPPKTKNVWHDSTAFKTDFAFASGRARKLWSYYADHGPNRTSFMQAAATYEKMAADIISEYQCSSDFQDELSNKRLSPNILIRPLCLCNRHLISYREATGMFHFKSKSHIPQTQKKERKRDGDKAPAK